MAFDRKLLLAVDKLVRDECGSSVTPSPQFVLALCEALSQYAQLALVPDLVAFAIHGKVSPFESLSIC